MFNMLEIVVSLKGHPIPLMTLVARLDDESKFLSESAVLEIQKAVNRTLQKLYALREEKVGRHYFLSELMEEFYEKECALLYKTEE